MAGKGDALVRVKGFRQPMTPVTRAEAPSGTPWARLALGGIALVAMVALGRSAGHLVPTFVAWVHQLGPAGPVIFIVGYSAAVVAFVPAVLFTLAAGAIFGLVWGTVYAFVAAVIGSIVAFLVARYGARTRIEKYFAGDARFEAIDRAVAEQGLWIVFLLRLSPVFPFVALNYLLGLTRVALRDYALASFGMIPGTLLYVYYGKVAGDVVALSGGQAPDRGVEYYSVLVLGLAATVAATILVTRIAHRALGEAAG
jgi:uncharacterized membrane protein YdjX (TVP38/TMEM64 family)